jgi:hypothetical protein
MTPIPNRNIVNPRLSFDAFDEANNPPPATTDFDRVVTRAMSRRGLLAGSIALGVGALVLGTTALTPRPARAAGRLDFKPVAAGTADNITVPEGYDWYVVASWGDPLWSKSMAFDQTRRGNGVSQELSWGDNTDGMEVFERGGRVIVAANCEYTNLDVIYGGNASKAPEGADDVRKGKAAHGITVAEIAQRGGKWVIVKDSEFNRRITADTPMEISGPARGHDLLKTAADASGTRSLGTWNNCGSGKTPWGTFLTCEENFNGYFSSSDANFQPNTDMKRYGVGNKDWGYAWATADERFDIAKHPNEPNRAGYVVEIDPLDPRSTPKKRTALGRLKHENAAVTLAANGQIAVYLGDDERGEFIYRFVSEGRYAASGNNADLLDRGRLFVAKFHDNFRGEWVELTPAATGMSGQAEICIRTRQAASKVGATTMDRPEWVAAHPNKAEVYCALTNNKNRGVKPNAGGDETPVGGPNPRKANPYGQIVRWRPDDGDHAAAGFAWDLFVLAGNPTVHSDDYAGSKNVTADNMFNSPDGLAFDASGLLWIQTDGNYSDAKGFAGQGNNQMLVGEPETGEIRRFLVGPRQCEVTGLAWSPDRKTMFVGIQHPGGKSGDSHFPDGGSMAPRSSIVAVTRRDGGPVG